MAGDRVVGAEYAIRGTTEGPKGTFLRGLEATYNVALSLAGTAGSDAPCRTREGIEQVVREAAKNAAHARDDVGRGGSVHHVRTFHTSRTHDSDVPRVTVGIVSGTFGRGTMRASQIGQARGRILLQQYGLHCCNKAQTLRRGATTGSKRGRVTYINPNITSLSMVCWGSGYTYGRSSDVRRFDSYACADF